MQSRVQITKLNKMKLPAEYLISLITERALKVVEFLNKRNDRSTNRQSNRESIGIQHFGIRKFNYTIQDNAAAFPTMNCSRELQLKPRPVCRHFFHVSFREHRVYKSLAIKSKNSREMKIVCKCNYYFGQKVYGRSLVELSTWHDWKFKSLSGRFVVRVTSFGVESGEIILFTKFN